MTRFPDSLHENWQRLGDTPAAELVDARLQLHWAAQIPASLGYTYLEPTLDWSHVSLAWWDDGCVLTTGVASAGFRASLRPADLTLLFLDAAGVTVEAFSLDGQTLEAGYAWLSDAIVRFAGSEASKPVVRPDHELPSHAVAHGATFSRSPVRSFTELGRWYANAALFLGSISKTVAGASQVRCWPHHFDIASLITLDTTENVEEASSLGVGLSPGDRSYPEPYWYVTPWPYPKNPVLPPLAGHGIWHKEGWIGAVLPGTIIENDGNAVGQAGRTARFLESAIEAALKLIQAA